MIPLSEAREHVLSSLTALPAIELEVRDALGCVSARAVTAIEAVPHFVNSAMDGFAVRSRDTVDAPTRLAVKGVILAGDPATLSLGPGEAARIMTGAALPDGADSVCKIEDVTLGARGEWVDIPFRVDSGAHVRQPGEDTAVGQVLIEAGSPLGPAHVGVLAGQGISKVLAHPRPRVGVLSTGDELSEAASLQRGKIRDSNRPTLLALLSRSGFVAVDLGHSGDNGADIAAALERGVHQCDAVISTGGVSVGDVDFVKSVLGELCEGRARWMQVAIKPGKPFAFGTAGAARTPIFGLPGNPVSALVSFELFVRPALRRLAGHSVLERPALAGLLDVSIDKQADSKVHLVHVRARFHDDGRLHVERALRRGSHMLSAVGDANAIAVIADETGASVGDVVPVMVLDVEAIGPSTSWPAR